MAVLVTGGAGYIGSHAVALLRERGEDVVVVDNLQKGHRSAVLDAPLLVGDIGNSGFLDRVLGEHSIDSVMHFAADSLVGESMSNPMKYYRNNLYSSLVLAEAMERHQIRSIVFSSTAAVYGEPERVPITESSATAPTSVYGETKLAFERALAWLDMGSGLKYVSLRYFNAAGAHPSGRIGEDHDPETHLVPIVLQVALGKRDKVTVYGDDYSTEDGTCVRDYIHVTDLAEAHVLALDHLRSGGESRIYNLGSGTGYSVKEIIEAAREVTAMDIPSENGDRRSGDPAVLIASSDRIKSELGWDPKHDDIRGIIESAWSFHRSHPSGFED